MSVSTPAIETVGLGRDYRLPRALDALDLIVGSGPVACACQKSRCPY